MATIQSLLVTCRLQDVDPYDCLVDVLQRIDTHPAKDVHRLTRGCGSAASPTTRYARTYTTSAAKQERRGATAYSQAQHPRFGTGTVNLRSALHARQRRSAIRSGR